MKEFYIYSSCQPPIVFKGALLCKTDCQDCGEVYLTLEAYETESEFIFVKHTDYKWDPDMDTVTPHYVKYFVTPKSQPRPAELYNFCQIKSGNTRGISLDFIKFLEDVGTYLDFNPHFFFLSPMEAMTYENAV